MIEEVNIRGTQNVIDGKRHANFSVGLIIHLDLNFFYSLCWMWSESFGIHKHLQCCICRTGDQKRRPSWDLTWPQSKSSAKYSVNMAFCDRAVSCMSAFLMELLCSFQHVDHYSRTKAIAEQLVMGACGTEIKGQGAGLKVCSLRCAGIYGEGERRHLPRIVVCWYCACDHIMFLDDGII